jgi:hypothetical protein
MAFRSAYIVQPLGLRCRPRSQHLSLGSSRRKQQNLRPVPRATNLPLAKVLELNRRAIRRRFEQRFTVERMAGDYVVMYREVVERGRRPHSS